MKTFALLAVSLLIARPSFTHEFLAGEISAFPIGSMVPGLIGTSRRLRISH